MSPVLALLLRSNNQEAYPHSLVHLQRKLNIYDLSTRGEGGRNVLNKADNSATRNGKEGALPIEPEGDRGVHLVLTGGEGEEKGGYVISVAHQIK